MGADLTIESKKYIAAEKAARAEFDLAVAARDKVAPRGSWDEKNPEHKQLQDAVSKAADKLWCDEWYFRDSYNGTSILNRVGYSWWQDVIPMLTRAGYLPREKCLELADKVEAAFLPPITAIEAEEQHLLVDETNTIETWNTYYQEKKDRLVKFLRRAAEPGNKLNCSL